MATYLLFESGDPFLSTEVSRHCELAAGLAAEGNQVTLFLVQNGVFGARPSARAEAFTRLAKGGVRVLADDFSLRERGIDASRLTPGVSAAPLDAALDELAGGSKALWL
jgi:predicted peroxiredoxin